MRKILLVLFIANLLYNKAFSQEQLTNIIPPSPEAASLAKHADIPVSLYTGTPNINIPLWNLKERSIDVPISIGYHASGNRVEDVGSFVGLGWSLNAGGVVTRSVRGMPDEYGPNAFLSITDALENDIVNFYQGTQEEKYLRYDAAARNCNDFQPDLFYFNFNGYAGSFGFDWNGNIVMGSSSNVSIVPNYTLGALEYFSSWTIITDDGTKYLFDTQESTDIIDGAHLGNCVANLDPVNSWYLSKITSVHEGSDVFFDYEDYTLKQEVLSSQSKTHNLAGGVVSSSANIVSMLVSGKRLSKIRTSSGQFLIEINPGDLRQDVEGIYDDVYELGEIKIRNSEKVIKSFSFDHDYSSGRLTLKTIHEHSEDNSIELPPYTFEYTNVALPNPLSKSRDHWGFYNGKSNPTLVPKVIWPTTNGTVSLSGANREPSAYHMSAGLINKIIYPTGGTTSFMFEPHDYSFEQSTELIEGIPIPRYISFYAQGGAGNVNVAQESFNIQSSKDDVLLKATVRIMSTTENNFTALRFPYIEITEDNGPRKKYWTINDSGIYEFELESGVDYTIKASAELSHYTNGTVDAAEIYLQWEDESNEQETLIKTAGGLRIKQLIKSDGYGHDNDIIQTYEYRMPNREEEVSSGVALRSNFIYEYLTTYAVAVGVGYTTESRLTRLSQSQSIIGSTQGSHVGYRSVTTHRGNNDEQGYSISTFRTAYSFGDVFYHDVPFQPPSSQDYARGQIKSISEYNTSDNLMKTSTYGYDVTETLIPAMKVGWELPGEAPIGEAFLFRYALGGYSLNLGYAQNTGIQTQLLNDNGIINTAETMVYNPTNLKISQRSVLNSDGGTDDTEYLYPHDFALEDMGGAVGKLMENHITGVVISKENHKNGNVISVNKSVFELDENTFPRLRSIQQAEIPTPIDPIDVATADFRTNIKILKYDMFGNALSIEELGRVTSYIWGYNNSKAIAKVENATHEEIFHTSFEEDGTIDTDPKTGSKVLNSGSFTFPPSFNPISTTDLKMTYWYWENSKWNYSTEMDFSPSISAGTKLDEIRVYPNNTLMSTYTYSIGVGITSVTDPNNNSNYFVYDKIGRLINKKDIDQNITNQIKYKYKIR